MTTHFSLREFVPDESYVAMLGPGEVELTRLFASSVMEPLRMALGVPIEINGYGRTQAGWRWDTIDGVGAAGKSSDHMVMRDTLSNSSCGAVDLISRKASAIHVFRTIAELAECGAIPYPREIIMEQRINPLAPAAWVHVAFPETFRSHYSYRALGLTQAQNVARGPRVTKGTPHRLWRITIDSRGARRRAVDPQGDELT